MFVGVRSVVWRPDDARVPASRTATATVLALAPPSRILWATASESIHVTAFAVAASTMSLGKVIPLP